MSTRVETEKILNVLYLEDSPEDAEIIHELLYDAGINFSMDLAEEQNEFASLLQSRKYDIILSDFKVPGFDAFGALQLSNEICPEVPFICISGTIGEETAIELLKKGAVDYLLKDRIERLPYSIQKALDEAKNKKERIKAENKLIDSELRYRRLFEAAKDGIIILDAETGMIVDVNPFLIECLGFSHEQFLGKKIWDIGFFKNIIANKSNFEKLQQEKYIRYEDIPLETADARKIDVEFVSNVYLVNQHKVIQCNIRDITERKRAEILLNKTAQSLGTLISNLYSGILSVSENDKIEQVNQAFCKLFYLTEKPEELLGITSADMLKKIIDRYKYPEEMLARIQEIIASGKLVKDEEIDMYDGRVFLVDIIPIYNSDDKICGRIWQHRDITEIKKAENREHLVNEVLEILNIAEKKENTVGGILKLIKNSTDFESVAIRLREGEDFPYYETNGFPDSFLQTERYLCARDKSGNIERDKNGKPELECMCGNILCGRIDPTKPFFTKGGSFWSNGTTDLLSTTTDAERMAHTRNRCNADGYESVALIPLKSGNEIIGLLQFNDHRKNRFTLDMINFFEGLGSSIGIALSRRLAEESLLENDKKLNEAQKMAHLGFWSWDVKTGDVEWSEEVFKIFHLDPKVFTPYIDSILELSPWEGDRDRDKELIRLAVESKMPGHYEQKFLRPDKSIGHYFSTFQGKYDKKGNLVTIVGTVLDITERKQTEEKIKEQISLLRIAGETAKLGGWNVDLETNLCTWSDEVSRIHERPAGYAPFVEEGISYYAPEWRSKITKVFSECAQKGIPYNEEMEIITANGNRRWVLTVGEAVKNESGKIIKVQGAFQDITERKLAETDLREKEYLLSQSQRLGHIGSWGWDLKGPIIWTDEAYRIYGVTSETFKPTIESLINLVHPEDRSLMMLWLESCKAGESPAALDFRTILLDGSIRYIRGHGDLINDSEGRPIFMGGTVQDITESKKAEEEIKFKNIILTTQQEASIDGILAVDENGKIISYNNRFITIMDIPLDVIESHSDELAINSVLKKLSDPEQFLKKVEYLYEHHDETSFEEINMTDGRILERYSAPMTGLDEKYYGRIWFFRDISERMMARIQLESQYALLSALINSAQDIVIFSVDKKYCYTAFNKKHQDEMKQMWSSDIKIGMNLLNTMNNIDLKEMTKAKIDRALRGEYISEIQFQPEYNTYYEINWNPISLNQEIVGVTGFIRNITERKLAEEEIKKLNETLEQRVIERTSRLDALNKELESFAYSVSHDLRAPLRAIDGFTRFLYEDYGTKFDEEGIRLLNVIRANTQKMDQLIADMLSLSKITRSEFNYSIIDMNTLANSIYNEVTTDVIRQEFEFKVISLPDAFGDTNLIRQVWVNLLSNAVKYTMKSEVKKIEVGFKVEEGFNVYYVKDTGAGFDPEYTHKLFGVFQRLHKTEEFEGTGIGLAIVQRIIIRHGGAVRALGKVNEGATFYFSLPVKEKEA